MDANDSVTQVKSALTRDAGSVSRFFQESEFHLKKLFFVKDYSAKLRSRCRFSRVLFDSREIMDIG